MKKVKLIVHQTNQYLHRYLSSSAPLHRVVNPTLNEKTLINPVRFALIKKKKETR